MQQDQQNYGSPNYNSGYSSYSSGGGYAAGGFKRINGLELVVVFVSLLVIISVGAWGVLSSNTTIRDQQRKDHITQVLSALDEFYLNSSLQPTERRYPVSVCSNNLNEVDYESTLRSYLTGKQPAFDKHAYINEGDYPQDPWGKNYVNFADKKVPFRCPSIFATGSQTQSYPDNYPSCDFSSTRGLNKCYLFTSSNNGDSFQIGYWSEVNKGFVVYSRFRQEDYKVNLVKL